jgi:hypothetical protein
LQLTIRREGPFGYSSLRPHFPPNLKNIQIEANENFFLTK